MQYRGLGGEMNATAQRFSGRWRQCESGKRIGRTFGPSDDEGTQNCGNFETGKHATV